MSLPPSHPSSDSNSQPGASIARWWQDNHDKISDYQASNNTPTSHPTPFVPPPRITIPVTIQHSSEPAPAFASAPPITKPSMPQPASTGTSTPFIDLLSNDDVASTGHTNLRTQHTMAPPTAHHYATPYSTYYSYPVPAANQWASASQFASNNINNINYTQATLTQHSNIISNMTATLNLLQGNQDAMHDQLLAIMETLQKTQSTLSQLVNNPSPHGPPSLTASSNSHSNSCSLSSDLSYTQENNDVISKQPQPPTNKNSLKSE
jgi:hypothetical protein